MSRDFNYLVLCLLLLAGEAAASTFVGNGGNAGDLDLSITLAEIRDTFVKIEDGDEDLCECPENLSDNKICSILRDLSSEQKSLCKQLLIKNKEEISQLAGKSTVVKFNWSDEPIRATEKGEETRLVDAVARREAQEIVINRARFLEMPQSYRIALITHELFHLVPINGVYVGDTEAVESFKVSRNLLDVLGAATAAAANAKDVVGDFSHLENVSRGYKKIILQIDGKVIAHSEKVANSLFKKRRSDSTACFVEYKPDKLGFRLGVESLKSKTEQGQDVTVEESMALYTLGAGYHWFPVKEYLSRWSEIHLSGFVDGVAGQASYEVSDKMVSLQDKSAVRGAQATIQVHIPIILGFWLVGSVQARDIRYEYKDLGISVHDFQTVSSFGGAYAF